MDNAQEIANAICRGDTAAVDTLLSAKFNPNEVVAESDWPLLHYAIEHGHVEIVRRLVDAGADVNRDLGDGFTPLVHAIDVESDTAWQANHELGHESTCITALLLAAGAEPTRRAIETAANYANNQALRLLESVKPI